MSSFVDDTSTLPPQADLTNERRQLRVSRLLGRRDLLYRASRVVLPFIAFPLALLYLCRRIQSDAGASMPIAAYDTTCRTTLMICVATSLS